MCIYNANKYEVKWAQINGARDKAEEISTDSDEIDSTQNRVLNGFSSYSRSMVEIRAMNIA